MAEENSKMKINDITSTFISKLDEDSTILFPNKQELIGEEDISNFQCLKEILKICFPTILFFMCLFSQQTINLIFMGHTLLDKDKKDAIDGIGISHVYLNCTLLSIVVGLISGFETLGSNAYGAKKYYLLGVYFHRAQLICYLLTFTMLIFHFFTAVDVLSLFKLDDRVLHYISEYIKIAMFFIAFDVQFSLNFRYLNIIGKSYINLIILVITMLLHPLWCYILIILLDLGVQGAALCIVISQMLNAVLGLFYILVFKPLPESFFFFNKDSFKGWKEYLKIAIPSAVLMCVEWWAFEILAIVAIYISKLDYTVHILICNIGGQVFTITIGFGMSTVILVGQNISKGNIKLVKKYSRISLIFGVSVITLACLTMLLFRKQVVYLFMDDPEVVDIGEKVIIFLACSNIFDFVQATLNSICRGLGKQVIASVIALVNFYLIQTTLAIILGNWMEYGVKGIWCGCLISSIISAIAFSITLSTFDLEKIKNETLLRLENDNKLNTEDKNTDF